MVLWFEFCGGHTLAIGVRLLLGCAVPEEEYAGEAGGTEFPASIERPQDLVQR